MTTDRPISRREFLKLAGVAGATAGLGMGLGGLLGGCGEPDTSPNTIATIVAGPTTTTTTTVLPTTTVSTAPERARAVRIGLISAKSGPLALFGKADDWWTGYAQKALSEGLLCGDGKIRELMFLTRDIASEGARGAAAADELISTGKVDILMCSGGAALVNPVAQRAQALGCPCLAGFVPWQEFVFEQGGSARPGSTWVYAHAYGLEDVFQNYLGMWERAETNRKVGVVLPDDERGRVWADAAAGLPAAASARGYEVVLAEPYPPGTEDFTGSIAQFKAEGCEICCGAMPTSDLLAFWKQVVSLEYRPKVVTIGDALLFPQALEAIGPGALNMTAESLWHPDWPYTDSITGKSATYLAGDYQDRTGEQWNAAIAQYAKLEWAVAALKVARSLDHRRTLLDALRTVRVDTCLGPIDFTAPVSAEDPVRSRRPVENVYKAPVGGVQWVEGDGFDFQPLVVTRPNSSMLPGAAAIRPMSHEAE